MSVSVSVILKGLSWVNDIGKQTFPTNILVNKPGLNYSEVHISSMHGTSVIAPFTFAAVHPDQPLQLMRGRSYKWFLYY